MRNRLTGYEIRRDGSTVFLSGRPDIRKPNPK
jgi:hypothetical protein